MRDADTSSVDTAVAGVTVTGKDVQDTYEKTDGTDCHSDGNV